MHHIWVDGVCRQGVPSAVRSSSYMVRCAPCIAPLRRLLGQSNAQARSGSRRQAKRLVCSACEFVHYCCRNEARHARLANRHSTAPSSARGGMPPAPPRPPSSQDGAFQGPRRHYFCPTGSALVHPADASDAAHSPATHVHVRLRSIDLTRKPSSGAASQFSPLQPASLGATLSLSGALTPQHSCMQTAYHSSATDAATVLPMHVPDTPVCTTRSSQTSPL